MRKNATDGQNHIQYQAALSKALLISLVTKLLTSWVFRLSVLFNDVDNFSDYIASVTDKSMSMEHCWNETNRVKPKYSEINASQSYFVQHKSHIDRPRIDPPPSLRGRRLTA